MKADRAGVREVRACLARQVAVELREAIARFRRADNSRLLSAYNYHAIAVECY
jgi:hypothetical protein